MIQQGVGSARIVDRGYQHYTGPRLGPPHAMAAMFWGALGRGLGLRRPVRNKILPWLLIVVSYLPTIVTLGFQIFANAKVSGLTTFDQLFNTSSIFYLLFAAAVAPDLICPDRRERVLALYFAAPITRFDYVAARCLGLAVLMLALTLSPGLVLFVGNALLSSSVADYVGNHSHDLLHIILSGLLLAAYFTLLSLAIASFTDRRTYAAGAILGLALVTSAAGAIISENMSFANHEQFALLDLVNLPVRAARWLLDHPPVVTVKDAAGSHTVELSGWACLGGSLVVMLVSAGVLAWQYARVRE
jgi:ABC-2 type transport system permease protein